MVSRVSNQGELQQFTVAGWLVDPGANTITKGETTSRVEPLAMSVLVLLARHQGETVTREELESIVWKGRVVGYDSLSNAIIKLRKAFGDNARAPSVIRTISKTGYRLLPEVRLKPGEQTSFSPKNAPGTPTETGNEPAEHSIAVLAFDNIGGIPEQEYFSDGLTEDIITDLSGIPGLFVIARNSSFSYKGRNSDVREISSNLGVRYILEGSVRRSGEWLRINVQLIDGVTGGHVWARRYDRQVNDMFSLQDEISSGVLTAIAPAIAGSTAPAARGQDVNVQAYDHFLRGRELALLDTEDSSIKAKMLLEKALEINPEFSMAHAHLCRNFTMRYINQWGPRKHQSLDSAMNHGLRAIKLDKGNPFAHFSTGANYLWMKRHDEALAEANAAVSLDQNFADGHALKGLIRMYSGHPGQALNPLGKSMRLDPHYRSIYMHILAQAHFHLGDIKSAVDLLKRRLVRKPDSDISRALLASCYGHLGEVAEAQSEWAELKRHSPGYELKHRCRILPYRQQSDLDYFTDGLKKAGIT